MCCKNQYKRYIHISPLSPLTYARNIGYTDAKKHFECKMCYKNQHKRHIRISPLSPLTHENIGHTDAIGTSSVGCAVNSIQTAYRSSCVYINVGASNNNNNDSNSNNSCIYETSVTSMRKALGVTACRSSRFTSMSEPRIITTTTTTTTHFNGSDGQKHGKNQGCQGWLLEEGALT